MIGTDCTGSCKSTYHTITTTTAPLTQSVHTYFAVVRRTNKLTKLVCKVVKYWNKIKYISKHSFEDVYYHDIIHMYVNYKILLSKPSLYTVNSAYFQSCTTCPQCERIFDYYDVCLLFTQISSSVYPVYAHIFALLLQISSSVYLHIWYTNSHSFSSKSKKKWFGVLKEHPIIQNILLCNI